jgi:hypothetical protein
VSTILGESETREASGTSGEDGGAFTFFREFKQTEGFGVCQNVRDFNLFYFSLFRPTLLRYLKA